MTTPTETELMAEVADDDGGSRWLSASKTVAIQVGMLAAVLGLW